MAERRRSRAQATVELSVVVVVIFLPMVFGLVGLGRVLHAQMAVSAVAREAARTGAIADTRSDAQSKGEARGYEVAQGYRLTRPPLVVHVNSQRFARCGTVSSNVTYDMNFSDLPLLGWAHLTVQASDAEPVDGFRSNLPDGPC